LASISNGGGGSSGEDSFIRLPDGRNLIVSVGGAGGGGGGVMPLGSYLNPRVTGGGGGGAGSGSAEDGDENGFGVRGRAGTETDGGAAGRSSFVSGVTVPISQPGQNISVGKRRNGGDSVSAPSPAPSDFPPPAIGHGGRDALSSSDGYLRIFRTRERTWQ